MHLVGGITGRVRVSLQSGQFDLLYSQKYVRSGFDIPEAIYWDVFSKFLVVVALNALFNIHFDFNKIIETPFFMNF